MKIAIYSGQISLSQRSAYKRSEVANCKDWSIFESFMSLLNSGSCYRSVAQSKILISVETHVFH